MTVTLNNRARPTKPVGGQQYFDWEVFVDESGEVLDRIDHVVYYLHETFPDPVRTVTDRTSKFACRTRGWGEFNIAAQVVFKDGRTERAEYRLDLSKSWD